MRPFSARQAASLLALALWTMAGTDAFCGTNAQSTVAVAPSVAASIDTQARTLSPEVEVKQAAEALGADDWKTRDAADAQLRTLSADHDELVLQHLLERHVATDDPEITVRAEEIMREVVMNQIFHTKKGYLGVRLSAQMQVIAVNDIQYYPIIIEQVMPNTAARAANLLNGDKIIKIDDNLCTRNFGVKQMVEYISSKMPGTNVSLVLWSKGKEVTRTVTLRQRPTFPTDPPETRQKKEFFDRWLNEKLRETRSRLGLPDPAG